MVFDSGDETWVCGYDPKPLNCHTGNLLPHHDCKKHARCAAKPEW